jgi:hypothetical protein
VDAIVGVAVSHGLQRLPDDPLRQHFRHSAIIKQEIILHVRYYYHIYFTYIYDLSIADVCLPPASSSKANGNYQTGIIETISRQQHFIIFH